EPARASKDSVIRGLRAPPVRVSLLAHPAANARKRVAARGGGLRSLIRGIHFKVVARLLVVIVDKDRITWLRFAWWDLVVHGNRPGWPRARRHAERFEY